MKRFNLVVAILSGCICALCIILAWEQVAMRLAPQRLAAPNGIELHPDFASKIIEDAIFIWPPVLIALCALLQAISARLRPAWYALPPLAAAAMAVPPFVDGATAAVDMAIWWAPVNALAPPAFRLGFAKARRADRAA